MTTGGVRDEGTPAPARPCVARHRVLRLSLAHGDGFLEEWSKSTRLLFALRLHDANGVQKGIRGGSWSTRIRSLLAALT